MRNSEHKVLVVNISHVGAQRKSNCGARSLLLWAKFNLLTAMLEAIMLRAEKKQLRRSLLAAQSELNLLTAMMGATMLRAEKATAALAPCYHDKS